MLFIASFTLGMIPFVGLIITILAGGYSTYFVYKWYKAKLQEVEASLSEEDKRIETMRHVGGFHQWVVWAYIVFVGSFLLALIMML